MSIYLQKSRLTVTDNCNDAPSTSSQLGHVLDQNSTRTTLQSCLECLDRLNDKIISVYSEMVEIRTRITVLLDNVQSEATVMDSGRRDSSPYLQAMFDYEHQNIAIFAPDEANAMLPLPSTLDPYGLLQPLAYGRFSDQEYGPSESVQVMGSLLEDAGRMISQRPP
ncbi:hypothetical protein BDR07DRAFT_1460495, partial [Suillus spraguei]